MRVADTLNRTPITLAPEEFGTYDEKAFKEAKTRVGNGLSP
jgi:hypothetical protein